MLAKGLGGKGKIDVQRFKGLGEMDAKDLKDTTMNPATRKLIRVSIHDEVPGETGDLVERLMGKKPELQVSIYQRERAVRGGVGCVIYRRKNWKKSNEILKST